MTTPLTLFLDAFFCSPFDFRCWVALREKGLDFSASRVMMRESQGLSQAYKDSSITARVPGLLHEDFWLAESMAIIEYLEEAFPPPTWPRLWPADVRERARARQVMSFLGADLMAMINDRPAWTIFYPTKLPPLSRGGRAEADELLGLAGRLVAAGCFARWSIASADMAFALLRLSRHGETLPPPLQALVDESLARPSVQSYLGHERPPNPPTTGRRSMV